MIKKELEKDVIDDPINAYIIFRDDSNIPQTIDDSNLNKLCYELQPEGKAVRSIPKVKKCLKKGPRPKPSQDYVSQVCSGFSRLILRYLVVKKCPQSSNNESLSQNLALREIFKNIITEEDPKISENHVDEFIELIRDYVRSNIYGVKRTAEGKRTKKVHNTSDIVGVFHGKDDKDPLSQIKKITLKMICAFLDSRGGFYAEWIETKSKVKARKKKFLLNFAADIKNKFLDHTNLKPQFKE